MNRMKMEVDGYTIHTVNPDDHLEDMVGDGQEEGEIIYEYLVDDEIIPSNSINTISNSLDQVAAENLIYMAQDGNVQAMGDLIEEQVDQVDNADYNEQQFFECEVTEEVITDDWVQPQGEERVEISVDQLCSGPDMSNEMLEDVPLPLSEHAATRPYPCDFCARRFRKKVNLLNHMVSHQHDRPHTCTYCGARYTRKNDLINHLRVHSVSPENSNVRFQEHDDITEYDEPYEGEASQSASSFSSGRKVPTKSVKRKPKPLIQYVSPEEEQISKIAQDIDIKREYVIDPKKPFMCTYCGVGFAREKALTAHIKLHVGDNVLECEHCTEMFLNKNELLDHQQKYHPEEDVSHSEYEPDKGDQSEYDNDSNYGDFYCADCGMSFHRAELLKRHTMKMHMNHATIAGELDGHCCNVCGESFANALDLLAHAEIHARLQQFKCILCGDSFLDETMIKRHISIVHGDELTPNTCILCGRHCRDGRSLLKHSLEHSNEKTNPCSMCGKTFHNKARLKRHMQSHRNKSVLCEVCHVEFPDGRSLMNHRHSHNNISGKNFPCKECGKTFGSRSSQQIHMRIHTGERPYGCRFCWKAFADGGTLRKHERIHTGEKPYACPVCLKAFNQRVVLREHIRSHHSNADPKRGNIYHCEVCSDIMSNSKDLIQHLINHSDANTAMKRQPHTGPRKYKRRRKLKPHEIARLKGSNKVSGSEDIYDEDDNEYSAPEEQSQSPDRSPVKVASRSVRDRKIDHEYNADPISYNNTDRNFNESFNDFLHQMSSSTETKYTSKPAPNRKGKNTKNTSQQMSRPKMIHTQKTRVQVDDGKRKTKTMITRRDLNQPEESDMDSKNFDIDLGRDEYLERGNVLRTSESEMLEELSTKTFDKFNPDVVSDLEEILRSPIKSKEKESPRLWRDFSLSDHQYMLMRQEHEFILPDDILPPQSPQESVSYLTETDSPKPTRRSMRARPNETWRELTLNKRQKLSTPKSITEIPSTSTSARSRANSRMDSRSSRLSSTGSIKQESSTKQQVKGVKLFKCDMCSATFGDRIQLMDHVPVHI